MVSIIIHLNYFEESTLFNISMDCKRLFLLLVLYLFFWVSVVLCIVKILSRILDIFNRTWFGSDCRGLFWCPVMRLTSSCNVCSYLVLGNVLNELVLFSFLRRVLYILLWMYLNFVPAKIFLFCHLGARVCCDYS